MQASNMVPIKKIIQPTSPAERPDTSASITSLCNDPESSYQLRHFWHLVFLLTCIPLLLSLHTTPTSKHELYIRPNNEDGALRPGDTIEQQAEAAAAR